MKPGRLWGYPRYEKLGELMAMRVAQQEVVLVPGLGTTLIPGAQGFHPDANTWYINPSYLPPSLLAYFAKRQPQQPWKQVAESLPTLVQTNGGFVMDWMAAGATNVHPTVAPSLLVNGARFRQVRRRHSRWEASTRFASISGWESLTHAPPACESRSSRCAAWRCTSTRTLCRRHKSTRKGTRYQQRQPSGLSLPR